jgi:hypothetical protein
MPSLTREGLLSCLLSRRVGLCCIASCCSPPSSSCPMKGAGLCWSWWLRSGICCPPVVVSRCCCLPPHVVVAPVAFPYPHRPHFSPFPPHEQLLVAVVGGAMWWWLSSVVAAVILSLFSVRIAPFSVRGSIVCHCKMLET